MPAVRMKHLQSKAVLILGIRVGSLLEQAFYRLLDAFLVCKVKRCHSFAILGTYICSSSWKKCDDIGRKALRSNM